jgi:hypothetical protein
VSSTPPLGGAPVAPGFTILAEIGRGGFGVVYRARDDQLGREVAMKVLSTSTDGSAVERFRREARAMGVLSGHPNVLAVHAIGTTAHGQPFLVMPFMRRGSLRDAASDGGLPWERVVALIVKLAGALETAHRAGIVHRDVKPDNVLVSDLDEPMLADFGIARLTGGFETRSRSITASVAYAAPEVLDGAPPSVATDLYALAATAHHLLSGHPPFVPADDESLVAVYLRIARDDPPALDASQVPEAVASVIRGALAKSPDRRPASAAAFAELLRGAAAEHGTSVAPPTILDLAAPEAPLTTPGEGMPTVTATVRHGRRRGAAAAGIVALLAIGGGVLAWSLGGHDRRAGPSSSASSTTTVGSTQGTGQPVGSGVVDATPTGGPVVPTDVARIVDTTLAAGTAVELRVAVLAGQQLLVHLAVPAVPPRPIPMSIVASDGSTLEETELSGTTRTLDPVTIAADGLVSVRVGPAPAATAASVSISLAPPDVRATVVVGDRVPVSLGRAHQRAVVAFTGAAGQTIRAEWSWSGSGPQYVDASVVGPDGTVLSTFTPLGGGTSDPLTLPSAGTYSIVVVIDGDGTGAGVVGVQPG